MTGRTMRAMQIAGVCVAAVLTCAPQAASAQVAGQAPPPTPPAGTEQPPQTEPAPTSGQRPYRGLFGGSSIGPGQPGLSLQFSGYGGHDDDLLASQSGQTGGPGIGGRYEGISGGLAYLHMGPKLTATATTTSDLRHYEKVDRRTYSHSGDLSLDFLVTQRTHLLLIERAGTSSLFRFAQLPGVDTGTQSDYGVTDRQRVFSDSSVQYTRELTNRSSLIGNGGYRIADADGTAYDLRVVRAGLSFAHQYSRYTNVRLGYTYNESQYGGPQGRTVTVNGLDVGGGYERPLSFSRRTTIRFTGGMGVMNSENPGVADPVRFIRATGAFGVQHQMGRTWTLLGDYNRGVQFVELFPDPFFVDSASVGLTGMVSRRIELAMRAAYANGQLQLNTSHGNGYKSYSATTDLSYAFSQIVALTVNYAYYNYDFGERASLPVGIAPALERQSIRLGVRVWVPVFGSR